MTWSCVTERRSFCVKHQQRSWKDSRLIVFMRYFLQGSVLLSVRISVPQRGNPLQSTRPQISKHHPKCRQQTGMEMLLCVIHIGSVTRALKWMTFPGMVCSMILEEDPQRTGRGDGSRGCREGRRHPGRVVKRLNRKGQLLSMSNAVRMRSARG